MGRRQKLSQAPRERVLIAGRRNHSHQLTPALLPPAPVPGCPQWLGRVNPEPAWLQPRPWLLSLLHRALAAPLWPPCLCRQGLERVGVAAAASGHSLYIQRDLPHQDPAPLHLLNGVQSIAPYLPDPL